jgi:hypothetical protein
MFAAAKEAEAQQATLIGELSHRVSNIMAVVSAMFQQAPRHAASLEDLNTAFTARLYSFAGASRVLLETDATRQAPSSRPSRIARMSAWRSVGIYPHGYASRGVTSSARLFAVEPRLATPVAQRIEGAEIPGSAGNVKYSSPNHLSALRRRLPEHCK